ncbi:MAG: SGNH/GDSL hydrolase family protein [Planctomycetaceae bacterium]
MSRLFDLPLDYQLSMAGVLAVLGVALLLLLWLRRGSRLRPVRRRIANLGLSIWIFLALVTAVELYFAVLYDESDAFNTTKVSKLWFDRHVAPVQKVLKFRDDHATVYRDARDYPPQLVQGQRVVCFVGDSFTYGHGVPNVADRFSDIVGRDLERTQPGRYFVANLADAGTEVHWIEALLEALLADQLPVDVVVYTICLNDIEIYDERSVELYREIGARAPRSWLFQNSYFFNLLHSRIQHARAARGGGYYSFLRESYAGVPWQLLRKKLDDIFQLCAKNGIDLRVVVFPFLHDLGPDYAFTDAHRQIIDFCRESGVRALDLQPVLAPHVGKGLTVNRFDAHPNERAHALAAEAIERELLDDLFAK